MAGAAALTHQTPAKCGDSPELGAGQSDVHLGALGGSSRVNADPAAVTLEHVISEACTRAEIVGHALNDLRTGVFPERLTAIQVLTKLACRNHFAAIEEVFLNEPDPEVIVEAIPIKVQLLQLLLSIDQTRGLRAGFSCLNDESTIAPWTTHAVSTGCVRTGTSAIPLLCEVGLTFADPGARRIAVEALHRFGAAAELTSLLVAAVEEKTSERGIFAKFAADIIPGQSAPGKRERAIETLAMIRATGVSITCAAPILTLVAEDSSNTRALRAAAIEMLGSLPTIGALLCLRRVVSSDPTAVLRDCARESLAMFTKHSLNLMIPR